MLVIDADNLLVGIYGIKILNEVPRITKLILNEIASVAIF